MTIHTASPSFPDVAARDIRITIGVVDPTSGGYFIARRVLERGFSCVAICSAGPVKSDLDFTSVLEATSEDFDLDMARYAYDAIIPGAESGVRLSEDLADRMGLPGNDPATTDWRRNKTAMAKAARDAGIALCRQARCRTLDDCVAWADSIGFPVVVKPEASSGSDLVRVCQSPRELLQHAAAILRGVDKYGQNTEGVLLQEYMVGDEYTVDGVAQDGRLTIFSVGRYRKINRDGAIIYDKIDFLAPDHPDVDSRILTYCDEVAEAVGVRVGPVHVEIMMTAGGPLLVEIAARAHGGIGTSVIDANFAPSFIDAIIDAYLDGPAQEQPATVTQRRSASIAFLISGREGRLVSAPGLVAIQALPSFVRMKWFVAPGERIAKTVDLATCPALIELVHARAEVIEADIAKIREIEASNSMLEIM
ncbi:ATP-grasp domain-containing protein [Neorhizobium sp. NPDC001467]|uniref:ATP-grasp domain-containing protein n=1 Tax=Neorhizobium sp. NPDC001467 TaxID=3390595 RepID=UPI003D095309